MISTQARRESAARAWHANPTRETMLAFWQTISGAAYAMPNGTTLPHWPSVTSAWLAWAKADAAASVRAALPMDLDAARTLCRAAGDTVTEAPPAPHYHKPAQMLAWFEASAAVRVAELRMGFAGDMCSMHDRDTWADTPDSYTIATEIARLRALGVVPAVLS